MGSWYASNFTDERMLTFIKKIQHTSLGGYAKPPKGYPGDFPLKALQPQLVVGEVNQAIMHVDYIPEAIISEKISWTMNRSVLEARLRQVLDLLGAQI